MDFIYHQKNVDDRAGQALARYALETNRRCLLFSDLSEIPVGFDGLISGSVETIQAALNRKIYPDYFPTFTHPFIGRVYSAFSYIDLPEHPCFIKPLDAYKRFDSFRYDGTDGNMFIEFDPPFQVQGLLRNIISECRYYISNGKVVTQGWYSPIDFAEEIDSPPLPHGMIIPDDWCGTIDVASTSDSPSIIIECHHPFSCGWYGESEDFMLYGRWLEDGWKYLK